MALRLIADDLDFHAWMADGLLRFEQLLAAHAAFDKFLLKHYDPDALDRLMEAILAADDLT